MSRSDIVHELFKPARKNFKRRKVILKSINDLLQLDLMDMQQIAKDNDSYRYVLVGINCFSKKGFAIPIKNKKAVTVAEATEKLLRDSKTKFKHAQTDMGTEFQGAFQNLMKQKGIKYYNTFNSETKASIAERFIRTLKQMIYKSMALRGTWRYVDHLDDLVKLYNNKYHRTIGMKPNQVNGKNSKHLLSTVYNYHRKVMKPKFSIGDFVRVSKPQYIFSKGYHPSWSSELFRIVDINPKDPVVYRLSNYDGTELIRGTFYEPELQKTLNKDLWLVEKILKKRGNQALVRWSGFGEEHDSWVKLSEISNAEA